MTQHDDNVSLRHMLDHAREAVDIAHSRTRGDLDSDRMLYHALTRLVEIVGEAASRVSLQRRDQHPEITWPLIRGTHEHVSHGYDRVDPDTLWAVIQNDLPDLIVLLEEARQGGHHASDRD